MAVQHMPGFCGCVAKPRPPQRSKYSFIALTGRSIISHLLHTHHVSEDARTHFNQPTQLANGQLTIRQALGVDLADPKQQELLGRLDALFNPQDVHLLLMDWIVMDNLPLHVVESERFRRFLGGVNPGVDSLRKDDNENYNQRISVCCPLR
jgi:hypothetical protein